MLVTNIFAAGEKVYEPEEHFLPRYSTPVEAAAPVAFNTRKKSCKTHTKTGTGVGHDRNLVRKVFHNFCRPPDVLNTIKL